MWNGYVAKISGGDFLFFHASQKCNECTVAIVYQKQNVVAPQTISNSDQN